MNRVVKNWNTLPETVVGAGSLNTFNPIRSWLFQTVNDPGGGGL